MSLLISCEVGGNKVPEQLIDPALRELLRVSDHMIVNGEHENSSRGVALQHHHRGASLGKRGSVKQSRKKCAPESSQLHFHAMNLLPTWPND